MESKRTPAENKWLALLEDALKENIKIQVNHRFKYKGKNLGTFLVSAKRSNNQELIEEIESLGLNFKMHSNDPQDYLERFILELSEDEKPNRQVYTTRFNKYVLPKQDIVKKSTIETLNSLWKTKFGNVRKWSKPENDLDKIEKWREFRYNKEINPNGKWLAYKSNMGKLYSWVYTRKHDPNKMKLVWKQFTPKERRQLKKEGFTTKITSVE